MYLDCRVHTGAVRVACVLFQAVDDRVRVPYCGRGVRNCILVAMTTYDDDGDATYRHEREPLVTPTNTRWLHTRMHAHAHNEGKKEPNLYSTDTYGWLQRKGRPDQGDVLRNFNALNGVAVTGTYTLHTHTVYKYFSLALSFFFLFWISFNILRRRVFSFG